MPDGLGYRADETCQRKDDDMNLKTIAGRMINRMGYRIYKTGVGSEYSLCPPYSHYTYSPWFEEGFQKMYGRVKDRTLCTEDRCYMIHRFARHCSNVEGDFAECGVYRGGTAFLIADTLKDSADRDRRLHLFDTFSGMPAIANDDPSGLKEGRFGDTSLDAVKEYLQPFSSVVFHPGFIPETFGAVKDSKFAFLHVDVDLYQTTKDCMAFFWERMTAGGVVVFDDYGFHPFKYAEKQAVDEFFDGKPEVPVSLRTGQCIVVKL
jgi:O-methyltransferase